MLRQDKGGGEGKAEDEEEEDEDSFCSKSSVASHSQPRAAGKDLNLPPTQAAPVGIYAAIPFISGASLTRQVCMVGPALACNLTVM